MKKAETVSRVYIPEYLGDSRKTGIGRQVYPDAVSEEEWAAAGSPVQAGGCDVYATSALVRPGSSRRDFWVISDKATDELFELEMAGTMEDREARYSGLVEDVERHLGRTGLTILAS